MDSENRNKLNFLFDFGYWQQTETPIQSAYCRFRALDSPDWNESETLQKRLDRILNKLEKTPQEKLSLLKKFMSDLTLKIQEFTDKFHPTIFRIFENDSNGEPYPFEHVDFKNMKDIIWTNLNNIEIKLYYDNSTDLVQVPYSDFEPIIYQKEKDIYHTYINLVNLYNRSILEYWQLREDWEFIGSDEEGASVVTETEEANNNLPTQIEQLFRCNDDYQKITNLLEDKGIYLEAEIDKVRCGKGVVILHTLYKKGWIPEFSHQILSNINRRTIPTKISKTTYYNNESASINIEGVDLSKIIPTYEQKK